LLILPRSHFQSFFSSDHPHKFIHGQMIVAMVSRRSGRGKLFRHINDDLFWRNRIAWVSGANHSSIDCHFWNGQHIIPI
uniref:Uncharacterized protein n=1 Tax=Haemonchus placei TaxID=6290 RepID=A0A0N4WYN2_HAEPC